MKARVVILRQLTHNERKSTAFSSPLTMKLEMDIFKLLISGGAPFGTGHFEEVKTSR
jgi:hypothetical protein